MTREVPVSRPFGWRPRTPAIALSSMMGASTDDCIDGHVRDRVSKGKESQWTS
jgi:hypothetical protein